MSQLEHQIAELHQLPRNEVGPVFEEPWQAQAFAMVVELHARGVFSWQAWTRALAAELGAPAADSGRHYYQHWLSALERILTELGVVDAQQVSARKHAWAEAYRRTPHGTPVLAP